MTDLVKCPFCGRTDKMVCCTIAEADDIDAPNNFEKSHYGVVCDASIGGCGASTGWNHETPEAAKAAWNSSYKRRASDWIPCSRIMPSKNRFERQIIYTEDEYVGIARYGLFPKNYDWEAFGSKVTHWIPLPDVPKEE